MPEPEIAEKFHVSIVKFISDVKNKKLDGSFNIAVATVGLLKELVADVKFDNAESLLESVKCAGRLLCRGLPQEAVTGNMVRRILRIIRDEDQAAGKTLWAGTGDSLEGLMRPKQREDEEVYMSDIPALRAAILEHITEFQMELDTCGDNITSEPLKYIHSNEIILTLGFSRLVEMFLKKAAEERQFQVFVAEAAPGSQGHKMAACLAKAEIETILIADSAIFAIMSRVNKVILGTQRVLACGGLQASVGTYTVALAAKHHHVPVLILCPLYKLCPERLCNYKQDNFNTLASPEGALQYSSGQLVHRSHTYCPLYDYVSSELVTLFITNQGGNDPSYVYQLLSDLYNSDDNDLVSEKKITECK